MRTEYRDYQYVMQDVSSIYIGAKFTYPELLDNADVPFKIKKMINNYALPDLEKAGYDTDLTLESHLYYLSGEGFFYQTLRQLKARIKYSVLTEKKGFGGKVKKEYSTVVAPIAEFVEMPPAQKEEQGIVIQELMLSKLALFTI